MLAAGLAQHQCCVKPSDLLPLLLQERLLSRVARAAQAPQVGPDHNTNTRQPMSAANR